MICNFKSLFYIFKKANNIEECNENLAKKIINEVCLSASDISVEEAFRRKYTESIFAYYNIISIKFYSKNTNIDNYNVKIPWEDWHDYFCEKMINEEYDNFYSKMHRLTWECDYKLNVFKFLFW